MHTGRLAQIGNRNSFEGTVHYEVLRRRKTKRRRLVLPLAYKQATPTGFDGWGNRFGVAGLWCGVCELPEHGFGRPFGT